MRFMQIKRMTRKFEDMLKKLLLQPLIAALYLAMAIDTKSMQVFRCK